jgi:hypothetical protein
MSYMMAVIKRRDFVRAHVPMDVNAYLSGYVDGEGCFCVSINRSQRHRFGWEIRPSFSVSQNGDRAEVLEMLKNHFGCGSIRLDRSDRTLKYEMRSIRDLIEHVIPHFERFPLLSGKRRDFEKFAQICRLMAEGRHLERAGFDQIVCLAVEMNPSGARKYSWDEIKI